jgi:hypothetical protein
LANGEGAFPRTDDICFASELGADITVDPRASSFFKAMRLCEGQATMAYSHCETITCVRGAAGVLLILDPHAMPFTRSWCCFELSMCMLEEDERGGRRLKFDVVIGHGKPQLMAEGLPTTDFPDFPVPLLVRGFEIDIAQSNASVAQDKKRILNSICGVDPLKLDDTAPPKEHDNYKKVQTGNVVNVR